MDHLYAAPVLLNYIKGQFKNVVMVSPDAGGVERMNLVDAVSHAFATMATGGFSTRNASVGAYNSAYIDWVITAFMLLAGMNFALHFKFLRGDFRPFFRDTELKTYISIFLVATGYIAFGLYRSGQYGSGADALRYAAFNASSILTTISMWM